MEKLSIGALLDDEELIARLKREKKETRKMYSQIIRYALKKYFKDKDEKRNRITS